MNMFFEIGVPKNFALGFSCEYCKIFKNSVFTWIKNKQTKRKQTCSSCFVNVFKFQENKFNIVQKSLKEIQVILIKKYFLEKPAVKMIIRWSIYMVEGRFLVVIDHWSTLICSPGIVIVPWQKTIVSLYIFTNQVCIPFTTVKLTKSLHLKKFEKIFEKIWKTIDAKIWKVKNVEVLYT